MSIWHLTSQRCLAGVCQMHVRLACFPCSDGGCETQPSIILIWSFPSKYGVHKFSLGAPSKEWVVKDFPVKAEEASEVLHGDGDWMLCLGFLMSFRRLSMLIVFVSLGIKVSIVLDVHTSSVRVPGNTDDNVSLRQAVWNVFMFRLYYSVKKVSFSHTQRGDIETCMYEIWNFSCFDVFTTKSIFEQAVPRFVWKKEFQVQYFWSHKLAAICC